MRKHILLVFFIALQSAVFAQSDKTGAGFIQYRPADSMLKIATPVKNQLSKLLNNKKQPGLRLIFTSDSAANNTSARWLAAKQQQALYRVHLAGVISKYAGETEKNLALLFSKAEEKNAVLFFDEADDLFAERSNDTGLVYFIEKINKYKATIIITCNGDNCISKLIKQNFTRISAK
jgi:hypothetical protein